MEQSITQAALILLVSLALPPAVAWHGLTALLAARSMPVNLVAEAFNLLVTAMPADLPRAAATARAGMAACSQPPPTTLHP